MTQFNNILVVCVGNLCRSPVGAALLRKYFPDRMIHSAGLAVRVDEGAEPTAMEIAAADGLDLSGHRARQLDETMVSSADLILVMTDGQRKNIVEHTPAASGKTMLFGQWLEGNNNQGRDIPDPIGKSRDVFEQTHRLLEKAARLWQKRL